MLLSTRRKISRPPRSSFVRNRSSSPHDLLEIFFENTWILWSYQMGRFSAREKLWWRFMHGSCTFLYRPPLFIQRLFEKPCAERTGGSREENQAGANKSGEINKTFPEGGFLFILAASFRPPTNFSCSSYRPTGKYLARAFLP